MANAEDGRVCKPDCEYWSGAPLSIKRCCRHIVLAHRSIPDQTWARVRDVDSGGMGGGLNLRWIWDRNICLSIAERCLARW